MARFLPSCGSDSNDPIGITTYVYMMLENRSYDHVLGARALVEGRPGNGLVASMRNPDVNGQLIAPWEPTVDQMCDPDPPHGWTELHNSWNNGACDGFVKSHQLDHSSTTLIDPMQYLTRTQMPISYALADAYTSCDNYFCSVMGPTLPNRAYWHTATSFGIGPAGDANNQILNKFGAGSPVPSIYNQLHDKNVDWAYYFGSIAVAALIGGAGPYQLDLGANDGTGNIRRFGDYQGSSGQFFTDAANGTLPPVSYIDPFFFLNDDHPPIHPINPAPMTISGNGNRVTLAGSCTQVVINGNKNVIVAATVGEIVANGNGNMVSWQKAIKGSRPLLRLTGNGNKVSRR